MPYKDKHNPKYLAYQKEWQRKYRKTEKYKEKFKEYYSKNRVKRIEVATDWMKRNIEKIREKRNARQKEVRILKGDLVRARDKVYRMVKNAKRIGALVQGKCEVCGKIKVVAHHPDYSKPLKVVWLCEKHHKGLHRKLLSFVKKV